jgi:hypothetical protein
LSVDPIQTRRIAGNQLPVINLLPLPQSVGFPLRGTVIRFILNADIIQGDAKRGLGVECVSPVRGEIVIDEGTIDIF